MNNSCLDELLDQINAGDAAAAERVFRTYEHYLRVVVRRQLRPSLRAKFDSMDIVQSVWADLLEGFRNSTWHFDDRTQLRAFLVRLARNRFLDRCRKHRASMTHERPFTESISDAGSIASESPRPSEVAQRDDLWNQMLALCPPEHHRLLRLKLQGHSLAEMADRTGLHPSSIRRILYDLCRRVADAGSRSWASNRI
jgi:RNA polymerase sigma-70 factor (ECF subfamily)